MKVIVEIILLVKNILCKIAKNVLLTPGKNKLSTSIDIPSDNPCSHDYEKPKAVDRLEITIMAQAEVETDNTYTRLLCTKFL